MKFIALLHSNVRKHEMCHVNALN